MLIQVPPTINGLRTVAMIVCCQQMKAAANIAKTIMRTTSIIVAMNSDVIPLSCNTFSDVMLVITPGAWFSLSNQLIYL